jgi:hypothetical protein
LILTSIPLKLTIFSDAQSPSLVRCHFTKSRGTASSTASILASGTANGGAVVFEFNSTGALNASFGANGILTVDNSAGSSSARRPECREFNHHGGMPAY